MFSISASFCVLAIPVLAGAGDVLPVRTSTVDLVSADYRRNVPFSFKGEVISGGTTFSFSDGAKPVLMFTNDRDLPHVHAGDLIQVSGTALVDYVQQNALTVSNIVKIGRTTPRPPLDIHLRQVSDASLDHLPVRAQGTVVDAFIDDIDPGNAFLLLSADGITVSVSFNPNDKKHPPIQRLIHAKVSILGVIVPRNISGWRIFQDRGIGTTADFGEITILQEAEGDPFGVEELTGVHHIPATEIANMGSRAVVGNVDAIWHDDRFLVNPGFGFGSTVLARLEPGQPLPQLGEHVRVVGNPETDLLHISLMRARWRHEPGTSPKSSSPRKMSARGLFFNWRGDPQLQADYHGRLLQIRGVVTSEQTTSPVGGEIHLACDGVELPLDISARPEIADRLPLGATVCVTGVFFVEAETWRPNAPFPRITGYRLIVRTPEDIEVVSLPSRWTTTRLLMIIGVLLLALAVIITWNRALRHLVNRRSRELLKSEIAKTENALRVDERTRLAVELHDSIAQNLTGVTLQLNASQSVRTEDPTAADTCLDNAMRMLKSCRTDLRRCIWDLRNDALDEPDFSLAIKKTLLPVANGAAVHIRFLVSRSRISDATAHAVLRILRELTANAVLHGAARNIRIAGEMSTGILKFSVRDDGRGFDTAIVQGPDSGHFGLTGIRERIKSSGGSFTITSQPGQGTYACVKIVHPKDMSKEST